eukprot:4579823-Pyramimonas_sp.AAC.1
MVRVRLAHCRVLRLLMWMADGGDCDVCVCVCEQDVCGYPGVVLPFVGPAAFVSTCERFALGDSHCAW